MSIDRGMDKEDVVHVCVCVCVYIYIYKIYKYILWNITQSLKRMK